MNYLNFLLRSIVLFSLFLTSCEKEPEPTADFMMSKTTAETDELITFTNSSKNADSYSWDFGDSNTSKANSPTHAYISVGTYTVKLTAKGDGGENFATKTITVIYPAPTADFMMSKTTAETGELITFTNSSKNADSYSWDFGDGNSSTENSPTHSYTSVGTYTVKLTVKGDGGENFTTKTITVIYPAPTADFIMSKTTANIGETITFTNSSENATTYSWDFGDGSTSTDANPSHYYSSKGIYKVILTATGEGGQHSTSKEITITFQIPATKFTGTNAHGRHIKFTVDSDKIKDFETQFILRISETQYIAVTRWISILGSITYTTENNFEVYDNQAEKVMYGSYSDNEIDGIYITEYGPLDFVASHSNKKSTISLNPVAEWFTNYQDINEFIKNMESLKARYNNQTSFELLE